MSRIQDALKKAEEESQAAETIIPDQPLGEEPQLIIPVAEPERECQPEAAVDSLEPQKVERQPDELVSQKSAVSVPAPAGKKTSQKIDLDPAFLDEHLDRFYRVCHLHPHLNTFQNSQFLPNL